jgi:hypothetical protein
VDLDIKMLLNHEIQEQTSYFILSDRSSLTFRQASSVPLTVFRDESTLLRKTEEPLIKESLANVSQLGFIYEVDVYDDDSAPKKRKSDKGDIELNDFKPLLGEEGSKEAEQNAPLPKSANSFYWKTSQDKMQRALDYGITNFEALTSKVIGAVGAYRLQVLERVYDYGIISNKYEQKEFLLRITQTRIRHMQALERLINAYDNNASSDDNIKRIQDTFEDYIEKLKQLKKDIASEFSSLNQYDHEANSKIRAQIQEDIDAAKEYHENIAGNGNPDVSERDYLRETILIASGPDSIAHFIKNRMIYALRQAQEHNQNMTYSRNAGSLFRGEFNSYCEDALKAINNHLCDHHNPITPQHQGYFSSAQNHSVTLDFRHLGKNRRTVRQYMMAITQIEGADKIQKNTEDEYVLLSASLEKPTLKTLKTTRFTSWDIQADWTYPLKRSLYWSWNLLMGIVIGLWDLPWGLISGIRGVEPTSNVSRFCLEFTPECAQQTRFHELAEKIDFPAVSLGARLGGLIGNLIRNTVWEVFKGVRTSVQRARFQIGENLATDYELGHNGLPEEVEIYQLVQHQIGELQKQENELRTKLDKKHKKYFDNAPLFSTTKPDSEKDFGKIQPNEIQGQFAQAPYELSPGEWGDLLNSAVGGMIYLFDVVFDDLHPKHPFSGLVYNTFYFLGTLAIFSPQSLSFLGKDYLQVSKSIADASSSNLSVGASFCASVESQLAAMGTELLVSGRNSWLLSGLTSLEEEPSNLIAYGAIAVGFGALLAYGLNIPYISAGIRSELGTVPAIALGVAGAKFGICLFELLQAEAVESQKDNSAQRERLKLLLLEHCSQASALEDEQINEVIDALLEPTFQKEVRTQMQKEIQRIKFHMLLQKNQHLLPSLIYRSKRLLLELMHQKTEHYPDGVSAMNQLLNPEQKRSILEITVSSILDYIPAIGGCLTTIVTWDFEPWRFLANKTLKDVGRIFHATAKIIKTLAHYTRVNVRIIFDVIFNETFARLEGFVRNDQHLLSAENYSMSSEVDTTYETAKEFFAQPVDEIRKAVTHANPQSFLPRNMQHFQSEKSTDPANSKAESTSDSKSAPSTPKKHSGKPNAQKCHSLFEINDYPAVGFFSSTVSRKRPDESKDIHHRTIRTESSRHDFN